MHDEHRNRISGTHVRGRFWMCKILNSCRWYFIISQFLLSGVMIPRERVVCEKIRDKNFVAILLLFYFVSSSVIAFYLLLMVFRLLFQWEIVQLLTTLSALNINSIKIIYSWKQFLTSFVKLFAQKRLNKMLFRKCTR